MVLAAEITGIALARTLTPTTLPAPAIPVPVAAPEAGPVGIAARGTGEASDGTAERSRTGLAGGGGSTSVGDDLATSAPTRPAEPARVAIAAPNPRTSGSSGTSGSGHRGTNHVWIPSLGISKAVQSFPCSRSRPPDAGLYRWGCAGRNNVYLLGHAWSTFRPLHDAYVGGRLRKGMQVIYADGGGTTHTYSVIWWRVVAPTTAASWAWASLSKPSMTLQTCVGANSAYRLMVRLVQVR